MRANVLIIAAPGRALELAKRLQQVPAIRDADAITGEYDIIAVCDAQDLSALGAGRGRDSEARRRLQDDDLPFDPVTSRISSPGPRHREACRGAYSAACALGPSGPSIATPRDPRQNA
jgi:hypothetical protein